MSNNNPKNPVSKYPSPGGKPAAVAPVAPVVAGPIPALFRSIDWFAFAITTLLVMIGYWLTLAPDLTLEDSGELAVGSYYAGIPHPPGYPVWTIYTWLFTLLPFSNIAFRVGLSSAVAAALSCGMVAMMVSRGSSMLIEGIAELKNIERRWENLLCMVSGFVAGMLLGFNGFMWSQAVIVEVYTLSVLSLCGVMVCLMRWIHAPHQYRYLYLAFFWYGICFNNHQSLLVIAIGMEVAILVTQPKLGRDLVFWNTLIYLAGLVGKSMGLISTLENNGPLMIIYNVIGLGSAASWVYLHFKTKKTALELGRDFALVASLGCLLVLFGTVTNYVGIFYDKDAPVLRVLPFAFFMLVLLGCVGAFIYLTKATAKFSREWVAALVCGGAWSVGAAFYLYMPLAGMTNPPMQWGYPRTVQGFFHAFTRGQYEKIHPTTDPGRYIDQIGMYVMGAAEEFNVVYLLIGLLPFLFYRLMQKRERCWLICVSAIYLCLSFFLLVLLNPAADRQSRDLNKVFFTASHVMIAMGIGYGLTLGAAWLLVQYERFRRWALIACGIACMAALYGVADAVWSTPNPLVRTTAYVTLAVAVLAVLVLAVSPRQFPLKAMLGVFLLMPVWPIMSHWERNEQHKHLFGYWFGHDMFTPPFDIYPEMDRDTVLYGGTDPGRFNPTYMIFCESFIPASKKPHDPKFDRRDVYLITQNALADGTYLNYIRAHYNRSAQIDPPFFQELFRGPREQADGTYTNIIARMMIPIDRFFTQLGDDIEKRRRVGSSFFTESDFTDLPGFTARLRPGPQQDAVSKHLYDNLSKETQSLLSAGGDGNRLRKSLVQDLNVILDRELKNKAAWLKKLDEKEALDRAAAAGAAAIEAARELAKDPALAQRAGADLARLTAEAQRRDADRSRVEQELAPMMLHDAGRFKDVKLTATTQRFIKESPRSHTRVRLNRLLLEETYPQAIAKSLGGVYPDREIQIASPEDSQRCFSEYLGDAQRRLDHDKKFPNEPRQIRPGEDVRVIDNRVQVSGQVAVMAINALLTKVMFDKNPTHEFYVEESFPLEWMYPYLTPFGVIMKINRNPLPELTDEIVKKDHDFWSRFSERLIGNWITYDTPVSNICSFAESVYHRRDYKSVKSYAKVDPKFVRDDDGQKAFSKLRSSIAGVYSWRIPQSKSPAEQQRMLKEAEFAFKQAYAFCPYSPEAVFRYINLLVSVGRIDDALLIAQTSVKLDPNNGQMAQLILDLGRFKQGQAAATPPPAAGQPNAAQLQAENAQLEAQLAASPTNLPSVQKLVMNYMALQQNDKALQRVDQLLARPAADAPALLFAAQISHQLNQLPRVEQALTKLVKLQPENAEAWFDLAGIRAMLSQSAPAMDALREALTRSAQRLAQNPAAGNLYNNALSDGRFNALRPTPEFQKLMADLKPPGK